MKPQVIVIEIDLIGELEKYTVFDKFFESDEWCEHDLDRLQKIIDFLRDHIVLSVKR